MYEPFVVTPYKVSKHVLQRALIYFVSIVKQCLHLQHRTARACDNIAVAVAAPARDNGVATMVRAPPMQRATPTNAW